MKKLILMICLLVPVNAVANSCGKHDSIHVRYLLSNRSEYTITLNFDVALHGENPDRNIMALAPNQGEVFASGCSNGILTGYETRATLMAHGKEADVNLAYLHIKDPYFGDGGLSYEVHNVQSPECGCNVRIRDVPLSSSPNTYDCSSYNQQMQPYMEIYVDCR